MPASSRPCRDSKNVAPHPNFTSAQVYIFGSAHTGGFNVVLCDGSVRIVQYNIDQDNFRRLGNREDGENLTWKF